MERERMPRPRTPAHLRPVPLSVYLPPDLADALRALCDAKGWTVAKGARVAVRRYLESRGHAPTPAAT